MSKAIEVAAQRGEFVENIERIVRIAIRIVKLNVCMLLHGFHKIWNALCALKVFAHYIGGKEKARRGERERIKNCLKKSGKLKILSLSLLA